jgi:hypothetical protein
MNQSNNRPMASKRSKIIGIIFALFGLLLFAFFVWKAGTGEITSGIKKLGAGFLLVLAVSGIRYIVRTLGWTLCFTGEHRLRFRDAFRAYIVGDAMGNLTPLGIVASEPTKAALVRDRLRWKFISAAFERLRKNRFGKRFLKEKQRENTDAVEDTLYNFYSRHRSRCALIMLLEVCFHLAGVLEVFVTLSFISDVQVTFMAAYVLESVNRIINVVFKFVPLRAGVDEAGSSWVTKVLKFGLTTGTTLAIIRKARVICWTALGVAFLIRRGLSTQAVAEETEEVMAEELGAPVAHVSEPG